MEEQLNRNCSRRKNHIIEVINHFFNSVAKKEELDSDEKEEILIDFQERVEQEVEYILDLY